MQTIQLQYLQLIARFIFERVLQGNMLLLSVSIILGVMGRLLLLGGFAMTLQAIVAAIKPDMVINIANKVLIKLGIGLTLEADSLIPLLAIALLVIYGSNWIIEYIRSDLMKRIALRIIDDRRNFLPGRVMDDDIFIIEQGPVVAQSAERCLEITLFIIMILSLFIFVSYVLVLMLLPLLALLVVVQVLGDRAKLRQLKEQTDARKNYLNMIDLGGNKKKREAPVDDDQRRKLVDAREHRRHHQHIKPQSDTFIGAISIVVIVYYLANMDLSSEYLAGAMIFFVIGLRYMIAAGRELSGHVSRLLDQRKHIDTINGLLTRN